MRRLLCMSCVLLVWAGSTMQTQARTDDPYPMVSSLIQEARSLRLAGDLFGSEARLVRAQRIAPRSSEVYLELAHLRKDQGDYTGLRDVVEFGANVSDGPSTSLAQLRALKSKLSVLLPLDSETPFSLPPVARDEVLDRQKVNQPAQDRSGTVALKTEESHCPKRPRLDRQINRRPLWPKNRSRLKLRRGPRLTSWYPKLPRDRNKDA